MKHWWPIPVAMLALPLEVAMLALPLAASSINADGDTDIVLHTGDELIFEINIQNYQSEAPTYGAPSLPSSLGFTLVTDPTVSSATFAAGIESISGSDAQALGGVLGFQPGIFESDYYSGPISDLSGTITLSGGELASLFAGGVALLYLEDLGGDVTIGLPPYVLPGDLYANASGGAISVGAYTNSAMVVSGSDNPVPEPDSAWLMLGGGAALCAAAAFLRRLQPLRGSGIK